LGVSEHSMMARVRAHAHFVHRFLRAYVLRGAIRRYYSIGDSHSGTLGREGFVVLHVGPVTAFRAGKQGELVRLISRRMLGNRGARPPRWLVRLAIRRRDCVLLFFGEIDVRAHFSDRWKEYGSVQELARFLAGRLATQASELHRFTNARVGIASVTPAAEFEGDSALPTRGSIDERVLWTRLMNSALADACRALGLPFVDTFSTYADEGGRLLPRVSDGTVHIRQDQADEMADSYRRAFSD
ncbi:MAG: SGNH/GDSL hydrolase family protein, partial [Ilumatobacteraceae bacterium]